MMTTIPDEDEMITPDEYTEFRKRFDVFGERLSKLEQSDECQNERLDALESDVMNALQSLDSKITHNQKEVAEWFRLMVEKIAKLHEENQAQQKGA